MSIIAKTGALIGLNALRNLVSDSMAIDMGSANTIIAVRGRGIVVDEPSVVAFNKITGEIIAVGSEAHKMQGREARDVAVIAPLVDGWLPISNERKFARPLCQGSTKWNFTFQPAGDHERAFGSYAGRTTCAVGCR
jgi:hypothetical protein